MSREPFSLPQGFVSFRPAAAPRRDASPESAPSAPVGGLSITELKELQRRAFERGVEHARAELVLRFEAAFEALTKAQAAVEIERNLEREAVGPFAVELALGLAEEMVGGALREGRHDVRALVESAAAEALPLSVGAGIEVHLQADDLAELEHALALRPLSISKAVELRSDPSAARGSCRIVCAGAEVASDPTERMKAAAARVRAEAARRFAEGGHDAL